MLFTTVLCAVTPVTHAQSQRVGRQWFYFRGVLGVGYGTFVASTRMGETRLSGVGALGNFALGLTVVAERLAVHVDACAMSLVTPTVSLPRGSLTVSDRVDATSTTSILGAGVTYNHQPWSAWASLTVGASILAVEFPVVLPTGALETRYSVTPVGWGFNLLVGKDWPMAYHWNLGLALQILFSQVPDRPFEGEVPLWTNLGAGLSLTVIDR